MDVPRYGYWKRSASSSCALGSVLVTCNGVGVIVGVLVAVGVALGRVCSSVASICATCGRCAVSWFVVPAATKSAAAISAKPMPIAIAFFIADSIQQVRSPCGLLVH